MRAATMAPFIRFLRVIAAATQSDPPRTTLTTRIVTTLVTWFAGIPDGVAQGIPYIAADKRTARTPPSIRSSSWGCFAPSSTTDLPAWYVWVMLGGDGQPLAISRPLPFTPVRTRFLIDPSAAARAGQEGTRVPLLGRQCTTWHGAPRQ